MKKLAGGGVASVFLVLLGMALWGGFNTALEATNTLDFCISCHEMERTVYQDYQHSVHASNPSGVQATCADCHVPKEWGPKMVRKLVASLEVYHWLVGTIDTQEKFDARLPYLTNRVWDYMASSDSRECRSCHDSNSMELEGQARFAASIHQKAEAEEKTCIDCHKGIAHRLPEPEKTEIAAVSEEDMEYGEEINETCAGCHGENGEGSADGEYPRLAGMSQDYLIDQLNLFKSRERLNIPMIPYTNDRELPEEDIKAIAAYLSSIQLPTKLASLDEESDKPFDALGRLRDSLAVVNIPRHEGNLNAGSRLWRKECATCHGKAGEGSNDGLIPPLAGQHTAYLVRQIEQFKKSERVHREAGDAVIFGQFGDSEINDILAFLSIQDD